MRSLCGTDVLNGVGLCGTEGYSKFLFFMTAPVYEIDSLFQEIREFIINVYFDRNSRK